jgi:hypothetical protein
MPAVKGEIQSAVWGARDAKWIQLEGERSQEKVPSGKRAPRRWRQPDSLEQRIGPR